MRRVVLSIAALLALAGGLAACGGGNDNGGGSAGRTTGTQTGSASTRPAAPPAMSTKTYRRYQNLICARSGQLRDALPLPYDLANRSVADYLVATATIQKRARAATASLRPPAALAHYHTEALHLEDEVIAISQRAARDARAGADVERLLGGLQNRVNPLLKRSNALATRARTPACRVELLDLGF